MNERIRELGLVATNFTNDRVLHLERVHNRDYDFDEIDEIFNEKFAELIVRECAEMMPQDNLYKMVLKRFGVEE